MNGGGMLTPLEPEIATSHALTASLFSINPQVAILAGCILACPAKTGIRSHARTHKKGEQVM